MKNRVLVVVADAARGRLFSAEPSEADPTHPLQLLESADLVNPEVHVKPSELFSDTNPRSNRGARQGHSHTYDDHRDQHQREFVRRFARQLAEVVIEQARADTVQRVVLACSHAIAPELRHEIERIDSRIAKIEWLHADLTDLPAHALHAELAERGYLPKPSPQRIVPDSAT